MGKEPSRKGVGRTGARSVVRGEVVGVLSFLLVAVTAFRAPRRVDRRPLRRAPVDVDEQRQPRTVARVGASSRRVSRMARAAAVTYEEDSYLPDCKDGEEESPAYDSGQDLGQVGATDPTLDDEGRSLLRLAAGEEIEELHHENFFDATSDVKASDATPDSGVHDLSGMDPEEKARQEAALRDELTQVEEEIQSLRTVLATKLARSQELKRQLGITVWKELKDDMEQGIKNIQDTAAYKDVSGKLVEWNAALTSAPIYQKTSSTLKNAGEKTTTALGTLGASVSKKLGEMKNSTAFKSVEEKVGSVYTNVKSKVSSRSSSVNSFEDALNSHPSNTSVSATPTTSPISEEKKPLS